MVVFPSYAQLGSAVSDASCVAITSPPQETGPQPPPKYAMLAGPVLSAEQSWQKATSTENEYDQYKQQRLLFYCLVKRNTMPQGR